MLWSQIDPGDPAGLVANLRATGCPDRTIRELVLLRVARSYRRRLVEADTEAARSCDCTRNLPPGYWNRRRDLQKRLVNEMSAELESLLGADLDSLRRSVLMFTPCGADRLDFLAVSQRRKVRDIEGHYQESRHDLNLRGMMGLLDAEDRAKLRQLELEKRAELAKILSSSELQEYLFRGSAAAAYVLNTMPAAKSEPEFRQMVQIALDMNMIDEPVSFHQRYGLPGPQDPDARELEARKAAFEGRVTQVLGEQRMAEQKAEEQRRMAEEQRRREQQSKEQDRARIAKLAAPLGISAEEVTRALARLDELRPALDSKFDELNKSLTGTREDKDKQMKGAMAAELEQIMVEVIGEKGRRLVQKLWAE